MESIFKEIKSQLNCFEVAEALGLRLAAGSSVGGEKAMYHAPHHDDKSPSLSIYDGGGRWKDWSSDESGTVVDLVQHTLGHSDVMDSVDWICQQFGIQKNRTAAGSFPQKRESLAEFISRQVLRNAADEAVTYLTEERAIEPESVERAIRKRQLGFNDYCSPKKNPGERFYGGPGVAFMLRNPNSGQLMAVETRYIDPDLNGGLKTQCQGDKDGALFCSDWRALQYAKTVYIVESCINALSVDSANIPLTSAVAIVGTGNTDIDWRFLRGKKVVICMDADEPNEKGRRPGHEAGYKIQEALLGLDIGSHFVDQANWYDEELNDVNDVLKALGRAELNTWLQKLEPWLVSGFPGDVSYPGKSRIFLPAHDFAVYWKYRCKEDFVSFVKERKEDENGEAQMEFQDVCGFRVAGISRVSIASATSTMSGEEDVQPHTVFAVSTQTPRHQGKLVRRVFEDERLHNIDQWQKFGPIFARTQFLRMVNIMERAAHIGARDAVNFVGLAWRNQRPIVNEGPDCYFTEPEKQCPYHDLMFPTGAREDAREVVEAYQSTFRKNAASMLLIWTVGAHLKAFLGFWPHMVVQADKGAGKSTLIKKLERTTALTMLSGQSLQTEFRLLTSLSHTSHPIGWEELSARKQDVIDKAVALLQESYQYTLTRRGSEMTQYLVSAPVMLAGEDVPVRSLTGKLVRTTLTGKKGDLIPENLARFPMRQWLNFLSELSRDRVLELHQTVLRWCEKHCRATGRDEGAKRMVHNYAALLTAGSLLYEFMGVGNTDQALKLDVVEEMNEHIAETSQDREPWVWVLETVFNEITARKFEYPYAFRSYSDDGEPVECLIIKPAHIMAHMSGSMSLRAQWDALPVKSDRVLKKQMIQANEVVYKDRVDLALNGTRHCHMMALSLDGLSGYGLHVARPEDITPELGEDAPAGRLPEVP